MCQIESVVHVTCRHWGKDRFYGEPCPCARRVKNGALATYTLSPWRNNSLAADSLPDYEVTLSAHPDYQRSSSSTFTRMPVYERSKAMREARRRTSSATSTLTISSARSSSSTSSTTSHLSTQTLSDNEIRRISSTGYFARNGSYIPAMDSFDVEEEQAGAASHPDEYVYLPCLYAEKVGCANEEGPCPRCVDRPIFKTPVFGTPRGAA